MFRRKEVKTTKKLTVRGSVLSRRLPVWVSNGLHGRTTQIGIRGNHSMKKLLYFLRDLPGADPFTP